MGCGIYITPFIMKRCIKCKIVKEFDEFNVRNSNPDGRHNICRLCEAKQIAERKLRDVPRNKYEIARDAKANREEFEEIVARELLTDLGYEIESDLSVHEQFLIRHNLI